MERIYHGPDAIHNPTLPQVLVHAARRVAYRTRHFGPRSGWVCFKTHVWNFSLRLAGRVAPSKRRACPCCGWEGRNFRALDIGVAMLHQIECPGCLCHDRHRMMHLFLQRKPPAFLAGKSRVLHFAPEPQVLAFLKANPNITSISTDIDTGQLSHGMRPYVLTDLHRLGLKDNCVDGIFIMHVLEHVQDDRAAIAELHRILGPGGQAVIMVPLDPSIQHTEEWGAPNPEIFGHYRNYSPHDFPEKLALFHVNITAPADLCTNEELDRFRIRGSEIVYLCTK